MKNSIKLDNNFSISQQVTHGVTLRYSILTDRISEKTGKLVTQKDQWYYPTLKTALKAYLDKATAPAQDVVSILERIAEVELKIDNICEKLE